MTYKYKFLRVKSKLSDEEINETINKMGQEGWSLVNFHPTSDYDLGKSGVFGSVEPWDVGYVFVFKKEIN